MTSKKDQFLCDNGKETKHFCATKNLTNINQMLEADFINLKQDILNYVLKNYEENINGCIDEFFQEVLIGDEELLDRASFLLMLWIIFSLPIAENRQTIFQSYLKKHSKKISRPSLKQAVFDWQVAVPSIYKVLKDDHDLLFVEDIFTKENKQIQIIALKGELEPSASIEGNYVLGTVIPYRNRDFFFATFYVITNQAIITDILDLYSLYQDELDAKQFIDELYPEVIEIVFNQPFHLQDIQWETSKQKDVIDLVKLRLNLPKDYHKSIESMAITLWKLYCEKTGGKIRAVEKYAAALHYLAGSFIPFFGEDGPTKATIAKLYNVKTTILTRAIQTLEIVLEDDLDNIFDELSFGLEHLDSDDNKDDVFSGNDFEEGDFWFKEPVVDEVAKRRAEKDKMKK